MVVSGQGLTCVRLLVFGANVRGPASRSTFAAEVGSVVPWSVVVEAIVASWSSSGARIFSVV